MQVNNTSENPCRVSMAKWLRESITILRSTYTAHLVCKKKKKLQMYKEYNEEGAAA